VTDNQEVHLKNLIKSDADDTNGFINYWYQYSNLSTWQFWINVFAVILSLVVLYFFIDRRHVFLVGFLALLLI